MTHSTTSFEHFDSVFMTMTQAFQELLSIAAKAETDSALVMLLETVDTMTEQLESAIDSHFDACIEAESTTPINSTTNSIAAKAENVDTNFEVDCDSALTQVRNNVAKLNIIVKAIATGEANIKTHGKEQLLKFIIDCYEGFEQILAFVSVVEGEGRYTFPSQVTEYIKSRQSILTTCYDNVAISE